MTRGVAQEVKFWRDLEAENYEPTLGYLQNEQDFYIVMEGNPTMVPLIEYLKMNKLSFTQKLRIAYIVAKTMEKMILKNPKKNSYHGHLCPNNILVMTLF